ncbi:hypothetical protein A3306_05610 [Rickettsia bellii]|uniref:Uncharacterized protein n=1 Tax=Rickettsia bellii (strain RML369-C) TaxID=336407 RepID=Q1RIR6_RICBR|nr:unknown [Rickettsia bellii RML369-C]ABV79183.1 hypothetical protein A1I_04165 [Rickettsia bellii OSU 85-389]ARD86625.1 hypothetical protein A3306_05610 [Rickettsia bellii]
MEQATRLISPFLKLFACCFNPRIDDKLFKKLLDFINITTNVYEIFKGSTIQEKRGFLNFVFANLQLKGGKLDYSLAFPFDKMQKIEGCPM